MMELAALRRNNKKWSPVDGPLVAVGFPCCFTRSVLMKPLVVWNFYKINMWAERIENEVLNIPDGDS